MKDTVMVSEVRAVPRAQEIQTQGKACVAGTGLDVTEGTHDIIHYISF